MCLASLIAAGTDPSSTALRLMLRLSQSAAPAKHVPLDSPGVIQSAEALSMEERTSRQNVCLSSVRPHLGRVPSGIEGETGGEQGDEKGRILDAHSVVYGWKQGHITELSNCFANFDRVGSLHSDGLSVTR